MSTSHHRPDHASGSSQTAAKTIPFAQKPHGIGADKRLHAVDRVVIDALLYYAQNHAWCLMSNEALVEYAGYSVPTIKRALSNIEAQGYIRCEKDKPPRNKTGRVIHLLWKSDPDLIPKPPPIRHEDRVDSDRPKLHVGPTPRRANPSSGGSPVSQVGSVNPSLTRITSEPADSSPVSQVGGSLVIHKGEGIQEQNKSLSPHLTSPRHADAVELQRRPRSKSKGKRDSLIGTEPFIEVPCDPAEVARVTRSFENFIVSWTPRTRNDVADLIAECGTEIVEEAITTTLIKQDGLSGERLKGSPLRYIFGVARTIKAEGGIQSRDKLPDLNSLSSTRCYVDIKGLSD